MSEYPVYGPDQSHEVASRKFSFFEGSKSYLEGHTLFMTSRMSGVSYRSTGVGWGASYANYLRTTLLGPSGTRSSKVMKIST